METKFLTSFCSFCGKDSVVFLDMKKVERWQAGELVQNVWPEMTPDERELLITGNHAACWRKFMEPEE